MITHANPFGQLSLKEIYAGLQSGRFGPRWPDEKMQVGYTGTAGVELVRRAFAFIDMLDKDGAFAPGWKGLDYGCGFGRFAAILLSKGVPDQFDCCDAWDASLRLFTANGFQNPLFKVPELLSPNDLGGRTYDFVLSFSVFTHLSPLAFKQNIPVLLESLKQGGYLYVTVRHEDFIAHKFANEAETMRAELERDGVVFVTSAGAAMSKDKVFGDTIISRDYLSQFGKTRYLGLPSPLQHVYAIKLE